MSWQQSYAGKSGGKGSRGGYSGGKGSTPPPRTSHSQSAPTSAPSRTQHSHPPPLASSGPPPITVSGCKNATVENIIRGQYVAHGANHGKPVYKKDSSPGSASVLIYFWDDRDGESFSGWWFGPKVGGDQVWAYNGNKQSPTPPSSGWQVPWDAPVDESLRLSATGHNSRGSERTQHPPSSGRSQRPPEDDGRRREAERQRQNVEQQRRDEERRQRQREKEREDELARKNAEIRRKKEEEAQRQHAEQQRREEERRQRQRQKEREEEQARRDAEMRRKKQEEEIRRKEQTAALAVRKVMQGLRNVTPETLDSLCSELQEAKRQHHSSMGSQADKVSQEATKAVEQAKQRVDEIVRKREQEEREREEEERRRKEEADRIEGLMKQAAEDVSTAEEKVQEAVDGGKLAQESTGTAEMIVELADAAEKMIDSARSAVEASLQKLSDKKKELGASGSAQRARSDLGGLEARLVSGRRTLDTVSTTLQASRAKAVRRAAALKKSEDEKKRFAKFDQDNDSKLSREELVAFAKEEYGFELPTVALDRIMLQLEPVDFDKFHKMQVKVAVAMLESKERVRRAEEAEKKRVLEEQRTRMQKVIDEVAHLVTTVEKQMSDAEGESKCLQNLKESSDMPESDILTAVSATEDVQKQVAAALASAAEKIKMVEEECSNVPALKGFDKKDLPRLQSRHARVANRSDKVTNTTKNAGEVAVRKAYLEIEQVRGQFVNACRAFMGEKEMTGEQLFAHVCKEGEAITLEQLAAFLADLNCSDAESKKEKLFQHITGNEPDISKCTFAELIRFFYKCVKATLVTEELGIKSKTIRRLEVGEVLEAVEGPMKEGGAGVQRVKCRAVGDGASGWVTIAGNQGTPFLEPGGNIYKCVREAVLSNAVSVQDSKTLRRLDKGEVVEVIEFSKRDEVVGVTRVKGRAKLDGLTGWLTLVGNQGTAYLEAC